MTFLPLVERELRERAQRRSTYWVRGVLALLATGIAMFVLLFMAALAPASVGKGMFQVLAWIAFVFSAVEGLRSTADSLSAENREGTLGLLFLTDLRGYDVVLGKFAAASLSSLYALLAMLPALAVPVLLGGVTGGEFWRLVLALLNALFFSLTAGTFVSSFSRDERRAWSGTAAIVLLFSAGLPALGASLGVRELQYLSPFTPFWHHTAARAANDPAAFWMSLAVAHALSWLWLALASFLLPRAWQESGARRLHRRAQRGTPSARQARSERLARNPVWWLASRNTHQRPYLWLFVVGASLAGVLGWSTSLGNGSALWLLLAGFIAVNYVICIWVAAEAANSFSDARSSGALELLLCTPVSVRQILQGQHLALRELFLGPVAFLLFVETALVVAHIWLLAQRGSGVIAQSSHILMLAFCLAWFVLDVFAVAEVALWHGLNAQRPTHALTRTVLTVLILPLVLAPCCLFIFPGVMVAKSVIFATWAQSKLEREFRRAATARFEGQTRTNLFQPPPVRLRMPGES